MLSFSFYSTRTHSRERTVRFGKSSVRSPVRPRSSTRAGFSFESSLSRVSSIRASQQGNMSDMLFLFSDVISHAPDGIIGFQIRCRLRSRSKRSERDVTAQICIKTQPSQCGSVLKRTGQVRTSCTDFNCGSTELFRNGPDSSGHQQRERGFSH